MELLTIRSSLRTPTPPLIINSSSSLPNQFTLLAQRCKLNIQKITWNGHHIDIMRHKILAHVLKEIEEACISKGIAVPIYETVDDTRVLPNHNRIPSGFAQVCHFEGNRLHKTTTSLGTHGQRHREWSQIFSVLTPPPCQLPLAKTTVSFLLVLPLLAFCIITALQAKNTRHRPAKKSESQGHPNTNSMRWKTVLTDLDDPEAEPDSGLLMEEDDREQLYFGDMPNGCRKLEDEYQKFLADCGMSKWGYWRGGSGSTSLE